MRREQARAPRARGERLVGLAVEAHASAASARSRASCAWSGAPGSRDHARRVDAELLQQLDEPARRPRRRRRRRRSRHCAPSATTLRTTLPAPPSARDSRRTCTTGTGASGLTRSTSPQRYSSSITSPTTSRRSRSKPRDELLEARAASRRARIAAISASARARPARGSPRRRGRRPTGVRSQPSSSRMPSLEGDARLVAELARGCARCRRRSGGCRPRGSWPSDLGLDRLAERARQRARRPRAPWSRGRCPRCRRGRRRRRARSASRFACTMSRDVDEVARSAGRPRRQRRRAVEQPRREDRRARPCTGFESAWRGP